MNSVETMANGLPFIRLSGSAYERGWQRGQAIPHLVATRTERLITSLLGGRTIEYVTAIADRYEAAVARHQPDAVTELHGIAEGSDIPWSDFRLGAFGGAGGGSLECSVFAATGSATTDGGLVMAKNGDLAPPMMTEDDVLVAEVRPEDGYRYLEMGIHPEKASQPDGMNEAGLTVIGCGQKVRDGSEAAASGADIGMSVYEMQRQISRQCATVDEAIAVLEASPRGFTGRTLILGDASGRWAKVEISYADIAVFRPEPDRDFPANHVTAGVSGTFSAPHMRPLVTTRQQRPAAYVRYDRYMSVLTRDAGNIDIGYAKSLVAEHDQGRTPNSICKHTEGDAVVKVSGHNEGPTLESFIFEPQQRRVWAAKGHPCDGNFVELAL